MVWRRRAGTRRGFDGGVMVVVVVEVVVVVMVVVVLRKSTWLETRKMGEKTMTQHL